MKKALVHAALCFFLLTAVTISANGQWIQTNWSASNSYFNLYASQGRVFARTWDSLNGGRMFLTVNNGTSWTQSSSADTDIDILSITKVNNTLLAGTWNGLYQSTSDAINWNAFTPTGIPSDTAISSIIMIDTTLFAGATGAVYKSVDFGNTWSNVSSGISANARILSIVGGGNTVFAGSDASGVFITTNVGTSWAAVNSGLADLHIYQLVLSGARLFAVTLKGVFVSDNNGANWTQDSSGLANINCFAVVDNQFFAGTDGNGVYLSIDSGKTWTSASPEMPAGTRVWSLAATSDNIFAGTSSGVWRLPITSTSLGDVNGDSKVDIVDALLIAQYFVGLNPPVFIASNADVNCSVTIDIIDALLVAQYYVGLVSHLGC